jgi:hypothetical protein
VRSVTEDLAQARAQRRQIALPAPARLLQVLQHLALAGSSSRAMTCSMRSTPAIAHSCAST